MAFGHTGMKILVVDEFPTQRRIVKTLFRQNGFSNFLECDSVEGAVRLLKTDCDIDLIVSDSSAPQNLGIELLKRARVADGANIKPFLIVTSEKELTNVKKEVNGDGYVMSKPFTGSTLKTQIEKIMKRFDKTKDKAAG